MKNSSLGGSAFLSCFAVFVSNLLIYSAVFAADSSTPIKLPATACGNVELFRNGSAIRSVTIFGIEIYKGSLFVQSPSDDSNELISSSGPKLMRFEFLRDASASRLQDGWREGLRHNAPTLDPQTLEQFVSLVPEAHNGGLLELCVANGSTRIDLNGKTLSEIKNTDLAKALPTVWLGAKPPSDEFKAGILKSR